MTVPESASIIRYTLARKLHVPILITDTICKHYDQSHFVTHHPHRWDSHPITKARKPRAIAIDCSSPGHMGGIIVNKHPRANRAPLAVVWHPNDLRSYEALTGLIHEIAHVAIGLDPERANEINSPMLALEAEMQHQAEIPASYIAKWMDGFGLGTGESWSSARWSTRLDIMVTSRKLAIEQRLMAEHGHLLSRAPKLLIDQCQECTATGVVQPLDAKYPTRCPTCKGTRKAPIINGHETKAANSQPHASKAGARMAAT